MTPEPHRLAHGQIVHTGAALALLPIGATLGYYALPAFLQAQLFAQFTPQLLAYLAMGIWASRTTDLSAHLGLEQTKVFNGLTWGLLTGLALGCLNTIVILSLYPSFGYDITFLKQTPHGRLPFYIMVPWFTCLIALLVEINFRGFLLGRLAELELYWRGPDCTRRLPLLALVVSDLFIRPLHGRYVS
jgi:hypothetical protein